MTKLQVEACPDLVLRPRSLLQEAAAHAALLDCAQSFSPRVEDAGCDTVLLDLAGMEPLFGPLPKIARDVARRASDLGLEANVAVASNPDTAVLAAHGFSGVIVIPEGRKPSSWAIFPWKCCLPGDSDLQTLEVLERWGIRNLRALAALPEIALSERLGQEGIRLQQLARRLQLPTLVPSRAAADFRRGDRAGISPGAARTAGVSAGPVAGAIMRPAGRASLSNPGIESGSDLGTNTKNAALPPTWGRAPPPVQASASSTDFNAPCASPSHCSMPKFSSSCCSLI